MVIGFACNYYWKHWLRRRDIKLAAGLASLTSSAQVVVEEGVRIGDVAIKARDLRIGAYTYIRSGLLQSVSEIGRFCSIGQEVQIGLSTDAHPLYWLTTHPVHDIAAGLKYNAQKAHVRIGHDVWIGVGVKILSGVTVGDGAVIATGAVVTKHVAPYEIVGGNPAKHIKWRFEDSILRDEIHKSAWWNLQFEQLKAMPFDDPSECLKYISELGDKASGGANYSSYRIRRSGCAAV
jgi:acetyltransferase-like isoleucine patch superfamily enzyme